MPVLTTPRNRMGSTLPDVNGMENPCFRTTKTATVRKLMMSCHMGFSRPVMLTAFLLKITMKAYMHAEHTQQHRHEPDEPGQGHLLLEQQRRKDHHDHGTAVVAQRRDADTGFDVGFKEEQPTCAHRRAGDDQVQEVRAVAPEPRLLPEREEDDGQEQAADQRAREDDL